MKEFEHLRVPLDLIKHATNNFGATNFIAEGGFGKVYKGEFQGEVFFHSEGRKIGAVKILDRSKDQADVSFWREIMLLSSFRHENLISLLGFCDESDKRIIIYEYASHKSLDFHLCSPDLTWVQRLKICLGAACGLQYLHDPRGTQQRVLHRDIKSANILLDENWNAKIADFGLSKHGPANQQYTFLFSEAKGTLGYCDPMYLETMLLTKESDIYSFGVVLFEVLCSRHCVDYSYNDERRSLPVLVKKCYREKSLHTIIDVNLKQQIKENSLDTFVTLAYQCLERDRTQRPSMEMVVSMLESALIYQEVGFSFCSFDFTDTSKMAIEKEIKRLNLVELVDYVQSDAGKITEANQEEMIGMISVNIFRCLPPGPHEITGTIILETANLFNKTTTYRATRLGKKEITGTIIIEIDEDDPYLDPSWPHLQLVYELLLRYIVSSDIDAKVAKRYINRPFVLKLLDMFKTEDTREREYLKTILHRIYDKFMVHRPFIRKAINNIFWQFIYENERNSGIAELLEILGSIINGFALPMKEEDKMFLVRALIPLHKPKPIAVYHQQLAYCITRFIEKDNKLADTVIIGLLKYWPVTNCQKEVLFLEELKEVLEATQSQEFKRCMIPLFRRIAKCLNSPHFQVAERALFMWNSEHIVRLIAQNRTVVFPIIFQALDMNIKAHWNPSVNSLTGNVRKMLMEMDVELFEEYQREYTEKHAQVKEAESQRQQKWQKLQDSADMEQIGL